MNPPNQLYMKTSLQLLSLCVAFSVTTGCNKPVSVLLVVGGHSYDTVEFYEMFRSLEGITFDSVYHPEAAEWLAPDRVDDYELVAFYDFIPGMELKDSSVYRNLTRAGIPLLFLHHALGTFQQWEGYEAMVGGKYVMPQFTTDSASHSDFKHDIDLQIEILDPDHPVVKGIDNFTIHDEGYSNIRIGQNVQPLFGTDHPDCSTPLGWVNQRDLSTCIYLMFGHDKHAYENESFRQILENSIHWLKEK